VRGGGGRVDHPRFWYPLETKPHPVMAAEGMDLDEAPLVGGDEAGPVAGGGMPLHRRSLAIPAGDWMTANANSETRNLNYLYGRNIDPNRKFPPAELDAGARFGSGAPTVLINTETIPITGAVYDALSANRNIVGFIGWLNTQSQVPNTTWGTPQEDLINYWLNFKVAIPRSDFIYNTVTYPAGQVGAAQFLAMRNGNAEAGNAVWRTWGAVGELSYWYPRLLGSKDPKDKGSLVVVGRPSFMKRAMSDLNYIEAHLERGSDIDPPAQHEDGKLIADYTGVITKSIVLPLISNGNFTFGNWQNVESAQENWVKIKKLKEFLKQIKKSSNERKAYDKQAAGRIGRAKQIAASPRNYTDLQDKSFESNAGVNDVLNSMTTAYWDNKKRKPVVKVAADTQIEKKPAAHDGNMKKVYDRATFRPRDAVTNAPLSYAQAAPLGQAYADASRGRDKKAKALALCGPDKSGGGAGVSQQWNTRVKTSRVYKYDVDGKRQGPKAYEKVYTCAPNHSRKEQVLTPAQLGNLYTDDPTQKVLASRVSEFEATRVNRMLDKAQFEAVKYELSEQLIQGLQFILEVVNRKETTTDGLYKLWTRIMSLNRSKETWNNYDGWALTPSGESMRQKFVDYLKKDLHHQRIKCCFITPFATRNPDAALINYFYVNQFLAHSGMILFAMNTLKKPTAQGLAELKIAAIAVRKNMEEKLPDPEKSTYSGRRGPGEEEEYQFRAGATPRRRSRGRSARPMGAW
jgi:hypothetical protein